MKSLTKHASGFVLVIDIFAQQVINIRFMRGQHFASQGIRSPLPLVASFVFLPYLPPFTCILQLTACTFNSRVLVICSIMGFLFCILKDQSLRKLMSKFLQRPKPYCNVCYSLSTIECLAHNLDKTGETYQDTCMPNVD